jgi:hypothetical protein
MLAFVANQIAKGKVGLKVDMEYIWFGIDLTRSCPRATLTVERLSVSNPNTTYKNKHFVSIGRIHVAVEFDIKQMQTGVLKLVLLEVSDPVLLFEKNPKSGMLNATELFEAHLVHLAVKRFEHPGISRQEVDTLRKQSIKMTELSSAKRATKKLHTKSLSVKRLISASSAPVVKRAPLARRNKLVVKVVRCSNLKVLCSASPRSKGTV